MTKPLITLKKIRGRSLEELRDRGRQAVSAYRESLASTRRLPNADEFAKLLDRRPYGTLAVTDEATRKIFFENAKSRFFLSTGQIDTAFRTSCGDEAAEFFIRKADGIIDGRFDLLGYKDLFVGTEVDWHLEPVSGIRSPAKHWKEFDETDQTETGDTKIVWELNRHQHFFTLGVAYRLTGNEEYARVFSEHLDGWINQNPPGIGVNWMSSLEVAFRSISWLWALNLFAESEHLTRELLGRAIRALYVHGRHIEKYLSRYYSPNTHLTGEALGLYYLGTQLPMLSASRHWRETGENILLDEAARQFHADGVYFEQTTWYQRYSVDFYLHFMILRERFGGASSDPRNATLDQRLAAALDHMMHVTRPDGSTPLIGDDDGGKMLPVTTAAADDFRETLSAGAARLVRRDMKFVAGEAVQNIFWLMGTRAVEFYRRLSAVEPSSLYGEFRDGGYFTMRDGWSATDDHIVVDCGELGAMSGGHGHADALSIDLTLHGRRILVDPGTYTYLESPEMRDLFRSTAGHNTVTVDGQPSSLPLGPFSWQSRGEARVESWVADDRLAYFCGSVSATTGFEHQRSIVYLKGDYVIIRDLVRASGKHEHALNFHYDTGSRPKLDIEGKFVGDDGHRMFVFADGGRFVLIESWVSTEFGKKRHAPLVRFVTQGRGVQEFFTFILPIEAGDQKPEVAEVDIAGGRAFVVKYLNYTDLIVVGDGETRLRTEVFSTDFEWTWARLASGETEPQEIAAINGKRLSLAVSPVVRSEKTLDLLTARRLGGELYIKTDHGRSTVACPNS